MENWSMPKVAIKHVYKTGMFCLKADNSIKTIEETVSFNNEIHLLSQGIINAYKQKYEDIHLGLVQISIKPLSEEGFNTSVVVALRDGRFIKFNDSLLAMVETSLSDGPVYFNCFPNYPVSLSDPHMLNVLTVNFEARGSQNLEISYRVCYRVNKKPFGLEGRKTFTRGETIVFQTSSRNPRVGIPRTIKWSEVDVPERWTLQSTAEDTPKMEATEAPPPAAGWLGQLPPHIYRTLVSAVEDYQGQRK